mgnify:FL=1
MELEDKFHKKYRVILFFVRLVVEAEVCRILPNSMSLSGVCATG